MSDGLVASALNTYHDGGWTAIAATPFVSLHSDVPGTNGAHELSGNGYSRQCCTVGTSSGGIKQNSTAVSFGPASGSQWSIKYYALWTAAVNGTFLGYWTLRDDEGTPLAQAVSVPVDSVAKFSAGELKFTLANT